MIEKRSVFQLTALVELIIVTTKVVINYQSSYYLGALSMNDIAVNRTTSPVQGLLEIGFSEYEARAYLELLRSSPSGAYELSKSSGIPSSKIYQALARLVDRGAALPLEEGGKTRYVPLAPRELVESRRLRVDQQLEALEAQLLQESRDIRLSYIWNISDYPALQDQMRLVIRETKHELVLSCWYEDIVSLVPELNALQQREGKIAIVLFGGGQLDQELEAGIGIYHHPIENTLYAERGGRGLTLVSDGRRALVATISSENIEGAWSMNRGFVLLAEDYVKHDIYLMKIVKRMAPALTLTFGENYRLLRNVFQDIDLEDMT